MGKYTALGKILMLNAIKGDNPPNEITHVGLFDQGTPVTGITGETVDDVFDKTSHGFANGTLIVLTEKTGGTGLFAGNADNADENSRFYFVVNQAANTFQVAYTPGGAAVDFGTDVTAIKAIPLVELSGGSPAYARKAIAYNNAVAPGTMDDSTNGAIFDVAAGAAVNYVGYFSAVTAGDLLACDRVVEEVFGAQGTYTLTDSDLDLEAA